MLRRHNEIHLFFRISRITRARMALIFFHNLVWWCSGVDRAQQDMITKEIASKQEQAIDDLIREKLVRTFYRHNNYYHHH